MRLSRLLRRRPSHDVPSGRTGFTMVELVTVALVMGTLARISVPDVHGALLKGRAAQVIGEFQAVQAAVLDYRSKYGRWPRDSYAGQTPQGLAEFLPPGFSFNGAGYQLDWENWTLPDGLPQSPRPGTLLGISVVTPDRELGTAVTRLLGGTMAHYTLGDKYTFVIERM
jgi:type II secretory pathway pseudopilin PulG